MDKKAHINVWYFVAAMLFVLAFQWWMARQQVETISYSEFQTLLKSGKIAEIAITDNSIRGELRQPMPDGRRYIYTVRVEPDFAEDLAKYDVEFTGVVESNFINNLLSWILPALMFFGLWYFLIRKVAEKQGFGGGFMAVGKSKAKVAVEKDIQVTFDDVAGVDEAKQELQEVVTFLKDPDQYGRLGAHIPKGVLLVGPPGTGKTLLARAVAGEAGVPFFSINGSEFVEMFVGVGAARVRDLFEQARKSAPCIIFVDEMDALGRARGINSIGGGADEKEQTLNQLLAELDGFDPSTGVVLLAATNRPEVLDPALLRAGRFDRQILVDRPDKVGRAQILKVHLRKIKPGPDVEIEDIAALTAGFSGADLANLVNEAAIMATRRDGESVSMDDFTRALERIIAGLEKKSRVLSPDERRTVAYHETGHALVTLALPGTDVVHKISIIPRGIGSLGYNIQRPTEDRYLMTRSELENKMACLLGGRAAEVLVFNKISTGASNDLDKATEIARSMVMRYGMDDGLGLAIYDEERPLFLGGATVPQPQTRRYSEQTAAQIDDAVRRLLNKAFDRATAILTKNRNLLDKTAATLMEKETLTAEELPRPEGETPPVPATTPSAANA
ncbi:ATP-dependent zinc metalloprotease FtsH [Hwanghaeella sp.]|uniref:ATP-dependent zinc metalloprotease FtsH n=1 Tax=Hwanghaeella sp. TaxID=2605943 RepID=UPI003CCBAE40